MSPTATATPGTSKVAKKALQKLRWGYKKSSPRNSKKSLKSSSGSSNSDKENQIPGTPELACKISMTTPKNSPGISKKTPKSSSRTPKRILRSTSGSSNSDKENQIPETSELASKTSNMSPIPETSKMVSKISSVPSDSDKENQPGTSGMTPKILKMSPNGTLRISEMSPKNSPRTPKMGPKSRVFKSSSDSSDSDKENYQLASPVVVKIAKLQNLPRNSQEFSFKVGPNAKQSYGRKLLCEMCNFSTDSQMSLKNHRALTCSDSVFTKFQCNFCPFQSQATRMIRSHIEREHSTIPKPSPKLNSQHFPKTSSEEEEGSLYSDE